MTTPSGQDGWYPQQEYYAPGWSAPVGPPPARRRWGRWVAFGVTTVVFAIAHLEWTRIPLLLVVAIPIGLARLYTDTLIASIVAHQMTNLLPGVVLMFTIAGAMPAM